MFRIVTVILISAASLSLCAENETAPPASASSQPAGASSADALLAAMSSQHSTNSVAIAKPATSEDELRVKLDLVRTLRFQRSFDLAEKQAGELVVEENPTEIRRLAMLEMAYIAQDSGALSKAQVILGEY